MQADTSLRRLPDNDRLQDVFYKRSGFGAYCRQHFPWDYFRFACDSLAEGVADEMRIYGRCPREPLCPAFINPKQEQNGTIPRGAASRLRMKLFLREQSYHHLAVPVL